MSESKTIYDKIWESHLAYEGEGDCLLYIDRHLIHEVTSPQAFEGLRMSNRQVRRPQNCLLYTSPSPRDQRGSRMPSSA